MVDALERSARRRVDSLARFRAALSAVFTRHGIALPEVPRSGGLGGEGAGGAGQHGYRPTVALAPPMAIAHDVPATHTIVSMY